VALDLEGETKPFGIFAADSCGYGSAPIRGERQITGTRAKRVSGGCGVHQRILLDFVEWRHVLEFRAERLRAGREIPLGKPVRDLAAQCVCPLVSRGLKRVVR